MSAGPVTIRDAAQADLADIRRLFRAYADAIGVDLGFQDFETELASLPGKYAPPGGAILIARTKGGEAVGCVALRPLPDGSGAEMKRLYASPEIRGAGLGRRLAEAIIDRARAAGHDRIVLDTLAGMAAAQSLYANLGFVDTGPYYDNPMPGTRYMALDLR